MCRASDARQGKGEMDMGPLGGRQEWRAVGVRRGLTRAMPRERQKSCHWVNFWRKVSLWASPHVKGSVGIMLRTSTGDLLLPPGAVASTSE